MMKTMRDVLSVRRVGLLLASVLFAACGGDDDPPGQNAGPGPSSGSTCPSNSTLTYENFGRQFFEDFCTRCHSTMPENGSRSGAPRGLDWDQLDIVRAYAMEIDKMAAAGPDATNTSMPPRDPRPTIAERQDLGEWLACGAP
jgi:uncharacterized membrane protein